MSATDRGPVLLGIARDAVGRALGCAVPPVDDLACEPASWLRAPGASFVTLTQRGALRGCIGRLDADRPLHVDVAENAVAAALRDPRFAPLPARDFERTDIEVSLLSAREPLPCTSEGDALAQLRPGVDGLVFEFGHWRSTFLPQVWDQLPEPADFLSQLRRKAGVAPDFWAAGVRLHRYTVTKWKETDLPARAVVTPEASR